MAAVTILRTHLTLLTLLLASPVWASNEGSGGHTGKHRRPTISVITASVTYRLRSTDYITSEYGDDIFVFCSSDDITNLRLSNGEDYAQAEAVNASTIRFCLRNIHVGIYTYICTSQADSEPLVVSVTPGMSVSSRRSRHTWTAAGELIYLVPIGEDFEVFCRGNDVESLHIKSLLTGARLETDVVNETTVGLTRRVNKIEDLYYKCYSGDSVTGPLWIIVDHYIEAQHFECIAHTHRKFKCSWRASSIDHSFKLFYVHKDTEDVSLLCSFTPGEMTRVCSWNSFSESSNSVYIPMGHFSLLLQTCNQKFFDNQTFTFNREEITKLNPPSDLKLLNTSFRGAAVAWRLSLPYDIGCEYRLEYRLLGAHWRRVNTSSERCDYNKKIYGAQMNLPCPDGHYEVRVYVRLKVAIEERYWSEPTSVFFYTDAHSSDDATSFECNVEFNEQEPPPSAAVVLHKVRLLISKERKENSALKKKMKALKHKRAKVKTFMESIAAFDAGVSASLI